MAYQAIDLGTSADDGTGDSLRAGGDKVNDNFSEVYTLLGTGTALSSGISADGTVVTLTAPLVGTSISPSSSDGAALGTTALEWSDLYLADGAVVGFGDDQDVTLTHVADTGLLLSSTDKPPSVCNEPSVVFVASVASSVFNIPPEVIAPVVRIVSI